MCNEEVKEYINIQTGEKLDWKRVEVLKDNAMLKVKPELWSEWDFSKNDELGFDIYEITNGSGRIVWWIGNDCGHKWDMEIRSRIRYSQNCPYCSGHRVLVGFNDMWTTKPRLASLLANPEDGYKYSYGSTQKVDWKCPDCSNIIRKKVIGNISKDGLPCPNCTDGKSYPEKVMYHLLNNLNSNFEWEKSFEWSDGKRYDFYLKEYNMIIEMHGMQHYGKKFNKSSRNEKEELFNDIRKKQMALSNGISKYIVIDSRKSEIDWIKNNILNSELSKLFDLRSINWDYIDKNARGSLLIKVSELWNSGVTDKSDLASITKLSYNTLLNYLNIADRNKLICFNKEMFNKKYIESRKVKVLQFDMDGNFIKEWNSIKEASESIGIKEAGIQSCCKGRINQSGGYIWIYRGDNATERIQLIKKSRDLVKQKMELIHKSRAKRVMQFSQEGELLNTYNSINEILSNNDYVESAIRSCCRGKNKSAYGYIWMYEDDYNKNGFIERKIGRENIFKEVVQLSFDGKFIRNWKSINSASEALKIHSSGIGACCNGRSMSAGGFIWRYIDDYENKIKNSTTLISYKRKRTNKKIVQLSTDNSLIKTWNSLIEATEFLGLKKPSSISNVLKGRSKTSCGFKWMYLGDYEKQFGKIHNDQNELHKEVI